MTTPSWHNEKEFIMPFGKYTGKHVSSIPVGYLIWCANTMDRLDHRLLDEILRQIEIKTGKCADKTSDLDRVEDSPEYRSIAESLLKSNEENTELNIEVARLRASLDQLGEDIEFKVKRWYRYMAKKWHPDTNSVDVAGMQAVNEGFSLLKKFFSIQENRA